MNSQFTKKLEFTGDRQLDQAQKNTHEMVSSLNQNPLTPRSGSYVTDLAITASSSKTFPHGLGRPIRGYVVTRCRGGVPQVYETTSDEDTLTLHNSLLSDVTIDIWVF